MTQQSASRAGGLRLCLLVLVPLLFANGVTALTAPADPPPFPQPSTTETRRPPLLLPAKTNPAPVLIQVGVPADFDQANKFYFQGLYTNAALAYETLQRQPAYSNATVYFNLGNAWYKAGQMGRAIAAYRQAQRLAPRDPAVRFNLGFVRKEVSGRDESTVSLGKRIVARLTLNEWTLGVAASFWLGFGLLAAGEIRPQWRRPMRGLLILTGVAILVFAAGLTASVAQQKGPPEAVVILPQAVVRYGPFAESQVSHQLRDGSEVALLDEKVIGETGAERWLQIRDAAGRVGWLRDDQVIVVR